MKVTNLDEDTQEKPDRPHPKRKLPQTKTPVNTPFTGTVTILQDGEVTEQMRLSYDRFWQLLIGRLLDKSPDP